MFAKIQDVIVAIPKIQIYAQNALLTTQFYITLLA